MSPTALFIGLCVCSLLFGVYHLIDLKRITDKMKKDADDWKRFKSNHPDIFKQDS